MPVAAWLRGQKPSRERIASSRWLRPFAARLAHPGLWHRNRRSVPRGVALGFAAAFVMPFAHMVIAAILAIPLRANVLLAVATTWVSNPLTWIVIFPLERRIGEVLIGTAGTPTAIDAATASRGWLGWLLATSGEIALGSVVLATVAAAAGYALSSLVWRWRVGRKWRRRRRG